MWKGTRLFIRQAFYVASTRCFEIACVYFYFLIQKTQSLCGNSQIHSVGLSPGLSDSRPVSLLLCLHVIHAITSVLLFDHSLSVTCRHRTPCGLHLQDSVSHSLGGRSEWGILYRQDTRTPWVAQELTGLISLVPFFSAISFFPQLG